LPLLFIQSLYITTTHIANKPNFTIRYTILCSTTFLSPQNQMRFTVDQVCHSRYNDRVELETAASQLQVRRLTVKSH